MFFIPENLIPIIYTQPFPHLKKQNKWPKKKKIIQKQLVGVHIDLKTVKKQLKFGLISSSKP